ncbi:hypothetical protein AB3N58_16390 [Leptospira sp. WS60.C2]
MNSKNPKRWETLLNDSEFESRIVRKTQSRVKVEKKKRYLVISASLMFLMLLLFSVEQWVIEPDELQSNIRYLAEELSSESIVSLSFD